MALGPGPPHRTSDQRERKARVGECVPQRCGTSAPDGGGAAQPETQPSSGYALAYGDAFRWYPAAGGSSVSASKHDERATKF
jgi:hypothetical protein